MFELFQYTGLEMFRFLIESQMEYKTEKQF